MIHAVLINGKHYGVIKNNVFEKGIVSNYKTLHLEQEAFEIIKNHSCTKIVFRNSSCRIAYSISTDRIKYYPCVSGKYIIPSSECEKETISYLPRSLVLSKTKKYPHFKKQKLEPVWSPPV